MSLNSLKHLLLIFCLLPAVSVAAEIGILSIAEGQNFVIREAKRFTVVEGMRIESGDIVQTGANAFVQVEFSDGSLLQLGPRSAAFLRDKTYLLNGWLKRTASPAGKGPLYQTPALDLDASDGVTLLQIGGEEAKLFVESGSAKITEKRGGGKVSLKAGDFYARKGSGKNQIAKRFDQAFVTDMPISFRDTLPARRDLFKAKAVQPKPAADFTYEDVREWLNAEPAVRRQFVQRWRAKAQEPAFRQALQANMSAHPEWDAVLNPEKQPTGAGKKGRGDWWNTPPAAPLE